MALFLLADCMYVHYFFLALSSFLYLNQIYHLTGVEVHVSKVGTMMMCTDDSMVRYSLEGKIKSTEQFIKTAPCGYIQLHYKSSSTIPIPHTHTITHIIYTYGPIISRIEMNVNNIP